MFRRTAPNRVENDDGIVVIRAERHRLEYRERERVIPLHCEGGFNPKDNHHVLFIGFEPPLQWEAPFENEVITLETLKRIRSNLVEAYTSVGSEVIFENDGDNLVRL